MFIRQNIQTLRFFRTTPAMRCPYLPHRLETKLVTELKRSGTRSPSTTR